MQSTNAARLVEVAHQRHKDVLDRAQQALEEMVRHAEPVTVSNLSHYAKVSRSWIYTQPELRLQIAKCQQRVGSATSASSSQKLGASADSLRRRLELAHQLIAQLRAENTELREALARSHGQRREESLRH